MNPNKEFARFFCYLFFSCQQNPVLSGGAHYIRRGEKKNAGCEAKTRMAETSISAAATAGSQVQNTGLVFQGRKTNVCFSHAIALKALIS